MEELSEESILRYVSRLGGSVRNSDLLKEYQGLIQHSDPQRRAQYRQTFKEVIDKVAVVKQERGEKYIYLKKKYQHLVQTKEGSEQKEKKQSTSSPVPSRSPTHVLWEGEVPRVAKNDFSNAVPAARPEVLGLSAEGQEEETSSPEHGGRLGVGTPEIRITEVSVDPQKTASCWIGWDTPSEAPEQENVPKNENEGERAVEPEGKSDEDHPSESGDEEVEDDFKGEPEHDIFEDGSGSVGSTTVALDPVEKNWMQCAARAQLSVLSQLLQQDPSLAHKKDFTSGFTALHWAAKHGKEDIVVMLANAGADVNIRAHGGYTPLHIAALHNHRHIFDLLISNYGAKEKIRDYSGRLPAQYLKGDRSPEESTGVSQFQQSRSERRNRKLAGLFLPKSSGSSKKKWGSMEDLMEEEEDKAGPHHLAIPASYKPVRKFSR